MHATTTRRSLLAGTAGVLAVPNIAPAQEAPGVTTNEIRIGSTNALSGPVSSYSVISRALSGMFKRLNDDGGVNGRKVNFIVYDDGYSPPKTLEQTRRLVEQDRVAFLFNQLGTPTNSAIHRYVNQRSVPHLFLATGADKWSNPREYPWTMGWQPAYRRGADLRQAPAGAEAQRPSRAALPERRLRQGLPERPARRARPALRLHGARGLARGDRPHHRLADREPGGDRRRTCWSAASRRASPRRRSGASHDIGWKPMFFMTNVSISGAW
jgi:branched-chain amino acid transport system substrate-binding protein